MRSYLLVSPDGEMSSEVVDLLRSKTAGKRIHVTVLMPSPSPATADAPVTSAAGRGAGAATVTRASESRIDAAHARARQRLRAIETTLRNLDAEVRSILGSPDIFDAVTQALETEDVDEIVLCQRRQLVRRLFGMDLRHRLQGRLNRPVIHVPCRGRMR